MTFLNFNFIVCIGVNMSVDTHMIAYMWKSEYNLGSQFSPSAVGSEN